MDERQELLALRRLAELEAKAKDGAAVRGATQANEAARLRKELVAGMPWYEKAAAGFGKAIYDVGRGAGQLVGAVSRDDVAKSRELDAALMESGAGMAGNLAGNVVMLAPTAMIPGANTIAGGAAVGAVSGLLQPSTSGSETFTNTALGGVLGGAVPFVSRSIQAGRALAEPLSDVGQQRIVGRALNRAAGADAPVVAKRLKEAATPFVGPSKGPYQRTTMGELVPGSLPTVGQAAQNPGVAALERAATATSPDVTNAVSAAIQQQNAARVGLLSDMAGDATTRAAADAARKTATAPLYQQATKAVYTVDDTLGNLLDRPVFKRALERAKTAAANDGRAFTFETQSVAPFAGVGGRQSETTRQITGQGLQDLKMALDALLKDPASGIVGKEIAQVKALRGQLVDWMEQANPAFKAARTAYAEASKPLAQQDIAKAIADKSVNKLTGNLQPNAYANALTDKTARNVTGLLNSTLSNTMEPAQMNALQAILADVQRANAAQNVGRGAGSDTVQKLAYTNLLEQSGVPTFLQDFAPAQVAGNLLARGADAVYGRANRELTNRLAQVMLDPGQAAMLMEMATPAQRNALLAIAQRAASGLAIAAPASANAAKE